MLNTSPHGKSDFYAYAVGSSSWNVRSPQPIVHVRTADGTGRENPDYVSIVSITSLYPLQKKLKSNSLKQLSIKICYTVVSNY